MRSSRFVHPDAGKPLPVLFKQGHDQKLRTRIEGQAGGLVALARLIDSAEEYASGKTDLFVYAPGGGLRVYRPDTGVQVANLACGGGHWNTPIAIDGKIALPEGNSNSHAVSGVLDIWRLP